MGGFTSRLQLSVNYSMLQKQQIHTTKNLDINVGWELGVMKITPCIKFSKGKMEPTTADF